MRITIFIINFLFVTCHVWSQGCIAINENGDFESRNYIPGISNVLGISAGEIVNWQSSHGTADYLDPEWNWYQISGIESNVGHICYGVREQGAHSEGMFTEVTTLTDTDIRYQLQFDFANICPQDKPGKVQIYLTNGLSGGSNFSAFNMPNPGNRPQWFEGAQHIGTVELGSDTELEVNGMSQAFFEFSINKTYTQLWFYTEYDLPFEEFVSCGFILDNVELTQHSDALSDVMINNIEPQVKQFLPVINRPLDGCEYQWDFGDGQSSNDQSPIHEFEEGTYNVCLNITDIRKACSSICKEIVISDNSETINLCDFSACLDGSGVPAISDIAVIIDGEERLLSEATNFSFPYCIAPGYMCLGGIYQMDDLIKDFNEWLFVQDIEGVASKESQPDMSDGCRGNTMSLKQTSIESLILLMTDESGVAEQRQIVFNTNNCNYVQRPLEESEVKQTSTINLKVYPTMSSTEVNIKGLRVGDHTFNGIYNDTGKLVKVLSTSEEETILDISNFRSGIYFVVIQDSAGESEVQRFIKI